MRLAYFSPLPPQRTGIADYSATLLAELRQLADVTLFVDDPAACDPQALPVRAAASFQGLLAEGMDLCLYQMGNNVRFHRTIYAQARRHPGLLILHDLNLYAFHDDLLVRGARPGGYLREMGYAYGLAGTAAGLDLLISPGQRKDARFPLLERLGQASLGVLVHSDYARRMVGRRCSQTVVRHVNQPVRLPPVADEAAHAAARARLGYAPDQVLAVSFGYAAGTKRIHAVLPVIAALRADYPQLRYAVVGQAVAGYDLAGQIEELGLGDIVRLTGFTAPATYADYQTAVDIGINLRYPTTGETSAALLGLLAAGHPALVSNVDAFVELPDAACLKIDPDAREAAQLTAALTRLLDAPEVRARMGAAGRAYIADVCEPAHIAREYVAFAAAIIAAAAPRRPAGRRP